MQNRNLKINGELMALDRAEDVLESTEECIAEYRSRMAASPRRSLNISIQVTKLDQNPWTITTGIFWGS